MTIKSATWDIETQDWTTFVCGAIHWRETEKGKVRRHTEVYDWRESDKYLQRLLSVEGPCYSFNGGRFDMKWLLDEMHDQGLTDARRIMARPSAIISIQCGATRFLDACLTFPMTLKDFTNGAKTNLESLCVCGARCGGYCAIRRDASPSTLAQVKDYNATDCETLWDGIAHFETIASGLGIDLAPTIGATAWKTVKRALSLPKSVYSLGKMKRFALWEMVRQAYYGGRDEVFKVRSDHGYQYDVNSMYPAAISNVPLPIGRVSLWSGIEAGTAWGRREPGVYCCTVRVPYMQIPPLPVRIGWRIAYPTGVFSGVWTAIELEYAQSNGVEIESIAWAVTWEEERVLFKNWVNELFAARMKFGKKSREGKWLKLVMNSLTGKFGTRCDSQTIHIDPDHLKPCGCSKDEEDCVCGGMTPFGGTDWMFTSNKRVLYDCARPEWAAYLTSASRVELHKQLMAGKDAWGNSDAVYCATDSCFSETPRNFNVGHGLGQWNNEGAFDSFEALAPKVYRYISRDTGSEKVRCKGIPSRDWARISSGKPIEFETMAGARTPVNGRFFVRVKRHRKVTPNTGARILLENGIDTRPMTYEEALGFFGTGEEKRLHIESGQLVSLDN